MNYKEILNYEALYLLHQGKDVYYTVEMFQTDVGGVNHISDFIKLHLVKGFSYTIGYTYNSVPDLISVTNLPHLSASGGMWNHAMPIENLALNDIPEDRQLYTHYQDHKMTYYREDI